MLPESRSYDCIRDTEGKDSDSMSNPVRRPPLRGIIIQGDRVVGGLDLPTPADSFIDQFNREYASLNLRVQVLGESAPASGPVMCPCEQPTSALAGV
jgi:hypothetical protein